uniref:HORMA domain-containing protein n=1 Tax=Panagrellus redivivus TaxID=6233 RepID=A0A7E4VGF0_PANRE
MSFASNNTVIKRVTYDWLIRFAELHPIESNDYDDPDYDYLPEGLYDPLESKYVAISSFFTTIITRYIPYIFQMQNVTIKNSLPQCPFEVTFNFVKPKPLSLFEAVVKKFVSAGYQIEDCVEPETSFNTLLILVTDNNVIIYP